MSKIKNCFVSRWQSHGVLVQVDFKQLEVWGLAYLSGDKTLQKELLDGDDIHTNNASDIFGISAPSKEDRRKAKQFTFELQYGASAGSIAKRLKIKHKAAKKLVDNYYLKYPGIKNYHERLIHSANSKAFSEGEFSTKGYPIRSVVLESEPTGREYKHIQADKPEFVTWIKDDTTFSPSELKNWGVQGFAGGDIVPLSNVLLYRSYLHSSEHIQNNVRLVNTIHDSSISDVHLDALTAWLRKIVEVYDSVPEKARSIFDLSGWEMLKFPFDIEIGFDWGNVVQISREVALCNDAHTILGELNYGTS